MNRDQARLFFSDYRRGTLDAQKAFQIRELLHSDSELRSEYDLDGRLEQLLALKRHERPRDGQMDNFLAEFHRRLRYEKNVSIWTRARDSVISTVQETFLAPASTMLRYGSLAAALAVVVGLSLLQTGHEATPRAPTRVAKSTLRVSADSGQPAENLPVVLASNNADSPVNYVLQRVDIGSASHGITQFAF